MTPSPSITICGLSERQAQVWLAIAEGKTSKEIAEELNINPRTEETYREYVSKKLGLKGKVRLARAALSLGLVKVEPAPANAPIPLLTEAVNKVLQRITQGLSYEETAKALKISKGTVACHVLTIYETLGCKHDEVSMLRSAIAYGLTELPRETPNWSGPPVVLPISVPPVAIDNFIAAAVGK
jgi:DNA-binding NarL/FixJ family response regulator